MDFLNNLSFYFSVLAFSVLVLWVTLWTFHCLALFYGKWRLHKRRNFESIAERSSPGVSILKPLCCESDPFLFDNLQSFFTMKYPKYELLFCIDDPKDSRLQIYVETLKTKYPKVDCSVFYGGETVGVNPKINNMVPGYKAAKYEFILVSDANIRMKEDTLSDMVSFMTESVGLVHQMPFSCDKNGLPSTLEKVFFGTSHARIYLSANMFGVNCVTGMSNLMRKKVLDELGGLTSFGCYLAEDYFLAQAFHKKGYNTVISSQPAWQNVGNSKILVFHKRLARWAKLRVAMLPYLILLEPLSECMCLGFLSSWAVFYLWQWNIYTFFSLHVLVWFLMDWTLLHIVQNDSLPFNKLEFLLVWLFREFSAPYLFIAAQINPIINWRNKAFRLRWGGTVEAIDIQL